MVKLARENRSKFLEVKCPDCENEQIIFDRACTQVDCIVCGSNLATPTGGKAQIKAEIITAFE